MPVFIPLSVVAQELPSPHGFVNDFANVIAAAEEQKLEALLVNLERQSGIEIAVVTLDTVDGDVDGYAVRLFETWGIGKKGKDEGLLILAAIQDRRGRIEVGYGLEPIIPDALAGRILREVIFPQFREQKYGAGLIAGTVALVEKISTAKDISVGELPAVSVRPAERRPTHPLAWVIRLLLLLVLVILFIKNPFLFLLLFSGGRGGGLSRSGGFSGGFGGFGGGLSGGGGASGSW